MFINPFKKMDLNEKRRESNFLKPKINSEKTINQRLIIVLFVIAVLFIIIVIRLFYIQVLQQDNYEQKLVDFTQQQHTQSSPRGTIFDRDGNILVESVSSLTISYYPPENISSVEEWELASSLVNDLSLTDPTIIDRNIKELHIQYLSEMENNDGISLLSEKDQEKANNGDYTVDELYDLKLEAVDVSEIDDTTRLLYQVKMRMDALPSNSYKTVVEDVSETQLAIVSENASKYPGFKATFDWKREYPEIASSMRTILGSVSSSTQGIPAESQEYYLALGYELNQRVGISGLEEQYENFLSGSESVYNINFDEHNEIYLTQTQAGKNGYDLSLTIDAEFQNYMQNILNQTLEDAKSNEFRKFFDNVYLVALNPQTGEIYGMVGSSKQEDGTIVENPTGTYLNAYLMGSTVKPAVLYMGQNEGVVTPGEIINDTPIYIQGSAAFASYRNYGLIDDVEALNVSSNIYMATIAMRLGGANYIPNEALVISDDTFDLMRNYFNMFGLGVYTGIDLPDEQVGAIGSDTEPGLSIHYSIGQYDTYTTMQLAQYVATLANGGTRNELHLLNEVTEVNDSNTTVFAYKTTVLNNVLGDLGLLDRGKQGMLACVGSGNCGSALQPSVVDMQLAAKTGTADAKYYDPLTKQTYDVTNSALIAYDSADNSQLAIACAAPNSNNGFGTNLQSNICMSLVSEATKAYNQYIAE